MVSAWRTANKAAGLSGDHSHSDWTNRRKLVVSGQIALKLLGYEPGVIDG